MIKIIVAGYGILSIVAAMAQVKVKNIPIQSGLLMVMGGMLMLTSLWVHSKLGVFILVVGILLAHASSLINGYKMYGFVNNKYNFIRLILSLLLIFLYLRV